MSLTTRLGTISGRVRWASFHRKTKDPRVAQMAVLHRILTANSRTAFGQAHRFSALKAVADYQSAVPRGDYELHRTWIDRIQAGERQVLTSDEPHMFSLTSGTTGEPKLIPVNAFSRRAARCLSAMWLYRASLQHPGLLDGRALVVVSPAVEGHTASGIPVGSSSGHIHESASWALRRKYAVPYPVFTIKNFESKYYSIMRFALERSVSFLATPNPSTIMRLLSLADERCERLIRDIAEGTLDSRLDISPSLRSSLAPHLRPNLGRARTLARMVERSGQLAPRDYWPDLALVGCWKGGSVGALLSRLKPKFAESLAFRDIGYLASEGQMTLPLEDEGSVGALAIDGNFYEFIPEERIDDGDAQPLTAWELEAGRTYYVILTTPAGLYRYDMNDVVRVTGFFERTPLLEFLRKGRDMVSLTGEKLDVGQLVQAVDAARRATATQVAYFRAVGHPEEQRYRLDIEFGYPVEDEVALGLCRMIDTELARLNIEYDQKRRSARLLPPRLRIMAPGWSARRVQAKISVRGRDIQFKDALLELSGPDEDCGEVLREFREGGAPTDLPDAPA